MITRILFLFLLCWTSSSQAQLPFTLSQLSSSVEGSAEEEYLIAPAQINNNTDSTIVIAWRRITEDTPEGWISYVCSNITCAPPDVNLGIFSLTAHDSTNLDVYFQPKDIGGFGKVELKLFTLEDTTESVVIEYFGNASPVSTQEAQISAIKLFPNPTTHQLQWTDAEGFTHYQIVNAVGIIIQTGRLNTSAVDVQQLPTGHYYLQLWRAQQKEIYSSLFHKN